MFGANPTRPKDQKPGQRVLHVQGAPFETLQGEGPWAGMPATFIRLWGCHLRCWFCDTDFESDERTHTVADLVDTCARNGAAQLVVLTGGEPMRQNITALCLALLHAGKMVQIETAGSFWIDDVDWHRVVRHSRFSIVCSPKTPSVDPQLAQAVDAWKYVVSAGYGVDPLDGLPLANTQDRDGKRRRLARPPIAAVVRLPSRVYVQPMDEYDPVRNRTNMQLCLSLARQYGYRMSSQQHKWWEVP